MSPATGKHKPYLRPDGVWVYRIDTGRITARGTRERLTVSSKNKAEATKKYRALLRRLNAGDVPEAGSGKLTVKGWADRWLPMHAANVRPTTYTTDRGAVRKWIIPTIGHRRVAELTPADLRNLRDAITNAGRSTTTALHAHKILTKMLKDARVEGYDVPDRVLIAPKPKKAANDRTEIPVDQALRILAVVGQRPDSTRWVVGLLYGMRQGETLGLTWDRVEFDDPPHLDLSWQLQHLPRNRNRPDGWEERHITGRAYWTRPKSRAGQRALPLVEPVRGSLLAARATWRENPWGLVWTDPAGLPIKAPDDRATWHAIQQEAGAKHPSGRPWHVHEMRHTAASILLRFGTSEHHVAAILGQEVLVRAYAHHSAADMTKALEGAAGELRLGDLGKALEG